MKAVLSGAVLFLCAAGFVMAQQSQTAPVDVQGAWMKSIPLKAEDSLTVYVDPANVILVPSDKKEVVIKVQGLPKDALERVQLTTKDKDIKLDFRGDKSIVGTFAIQLPSTFNLDLYSSGNVEVQGALNGKIRFRTTSGTLNVRDVTGNLTVESTDSDVYVGNIHGNGNLSTNGDLEVEDVTGDLNLKNRSGDTFAKNVTGNFDARSEDGDISAGDVGGNATVNAGLGDVDLHKVTGVATITTQDGDIDLFEVPGMVVAQSGSGEITLRKVTGAADAKTQDGDISAEMYAGSGGSSKFYTHDGDISMYFPPTAKATLSAKFHAEAPAGNTADAADEASDVITSDWPVVNTQKQAGDIINKYEINGGGDSVLVETVGGEIVVKKLNPKQETPPAVKKKPN